MSKKKLAGIIIGCTIAIIVAIILIHFEPWEGTSSAETYTLTTSVSPSGTGSISPAGGQYDSGEQVILTASPAGGYTFDHWSGSASDTTSTITITMDSDKSLTAHFESPCASDAISCTEAKNHIGERTTVYGVVVDTSYASGSSGQPTFLNLCYAYPSPNRFTVVIWGENRGNFSQPPEDYYDGKTIYVTGLIVSYQGVPEIEVSSPDQICEP
jgi:uncharacterized repeat protein (TIGR02543 family)